MNEENLVKPHPRDEVLVEAMKFREKQELAKAAKREEDLEEKRMKNIRSEKERKQRCKKVYEDSFFILVSKYLALDGKYCSAYIESLSERQLKELEDIVFEKAKKFLWLKKIFVVSIGLAIPIFGWFGLFCIFCADGCDFPSYKFVALRDWYRKEFRLIYSPRPEHVIPNFRD